MQLYHSILSMSIFTRISSALIGLMRGKPAKQKFLHLQQTKKEERKLKNFLAKKWPYYAD